jgi:hypothetical protein
MAPRPHMIWYQLTREEILMSRNEGTLDRALRIIAGLALLSLIFIGPQTLWGLIGIVPLVTGLVGVCPVYSVFGINTCKVKPS